jgi:release factor glutamine methyltransferase
VREHAANSIAQLLEEATQALAAAGCDTPRLDTEVLMAHELAEDRAWLYAHSDYILPPSQLNSFQILVACRARREPVAYLTGTKEFYGLDFLVTPDVLIPRPETEQLAEMALGWLTNVPGNGTIVDVGTGTRRNAVRHKIADRLHCIQADLLAPLSRDLQLIVANPPYLSWSDLAAAPPEVARWEPRAALDGGQDGLAVIRRLLPMAALRLSPAGALLVEIGAEQGEEALALARHCFPHATAQIVKDLAGRDRVLFVKNTQ